MPSYDPERQRQMRAERIAAGICVRCGIAPARKGRQMCFRCAMLCHDCYLRRKQALGIHQGTMGRKPIYRYTVRDGETILVSGNAHECAAYFGMTAGAVAHDALYGRRIQAIYGITRDRIDGGADDV